MEPQWLKAFLAVFKTGGFSSAAKLIHLSQPAVSRQIKMLEEALGVRLFERFGPLQVQATEEGKLFAQIAGPDLERFETIRERFHSLLGRAVMPLLKIATHESVLTNQLPDLIMRFKRMHPDVKIQLFRKNKDEIINMVLSGKVDFGITALDKAPPGTDLQVYAKYKRMLVVPKGHHLLKVPHVSIAEIAKYHMILPPDESNTRQAVEKVFQKTGLQINLTLETMGRDATKKYIAAGLGLSIMNEFYLLPTDKKLLSWKDVSNCFGQSNRGVLTRKGKSLTTTQKEFIELLIRK